MSATTTIATTTSVEILHHTATFLSEVLSQPNLRHHLFSTFLQRLPSTLIKPLNSASQTIEKAISNAASSSLRSAEKLLLSNSHNPFSSFLLSLVRYLRHREIDASLSLLDVFQADPSLCRLEIAPFLFQELFLVHFAPMLEWYNVQRSSILSSFSLTSDYNSDDQSIISNTTLLSKMSGDQASALKDLERDYEDLLDENCRIFVEYFKRILRNKDGEQVIVPPPTVVLQIRQTADKLVYSDEEKIKNQEFESTNRRYNPMWAGGDRSVEFSSNRDKSLSKFPSFVPERVSPKVITNQRLSKESETSTENNSGAKLHSSANENLSDYSSSDSEAESKMALFDSRKITSQKQKQPLLLEESRRSPQLFMEDIDNVLGGGKNTPPKDFVCPITTHVFDDPVTLETGQTYERKAIQEWIDRGNSTCPITRQKLSSTQLPKTNYVLKRLIASWQEQNQGSALSQFKVMQAKVSPEILSVSPNSVISQATIDGTMSELRLAITDLCTSEILREAETAVLKIERFWEEGNMQLEMISMLTKPPVINGFVEILFNSVDKQVLKATILLLTELGSRDVSVIQTLTAVDSDVECIVELFKKGLLEAVVLVHLLRPQATSLVEMDLVDYLLTMLGNKEDDDSKKMCMNPRTASLILLGEIIRSSNEARLVKIVRSIVTTNTIEKIVVSLQAEHIEERIAAVIILLRCVLEDGKCRNIIAEKAELAPVLEIFVGVNDAERFEIVHLLSELVKLNRRNLNEQFLHLLKDEGTFSTMHNLLMYLQNTLQDQSPIVAGLLLQLDLLVWSSEGSELHLIQEICEHTKAVTSLAVLHSSDKLYSGSLDRTVRVWVISVEGIYCEQVQEMKDHINNLVVANNIACYIPQGAGIKTWVLS
ncbi:putative E3 ubiquitin-protein ligase LIN [Sesamum angolense]|uniref:RING-type E3 ubiquitin transferase n=1 Tax=Sesamum angolense TaxID=2727404 RepID=A0AAE2BN92_9LAMI|nr:putative E3 ubiquitin-protein ligase LIN [Sesamum angolense]